MPLTPWFDRSDLLAAFNKRVDGFRAGYRQNIALLGPESVGKTTFLKRLIQEKASAHFIPFYLEVRESESLVEWALRFIETLLHGICQTQSPQKISVEFSQLLQVCSSVAPQTAAKARGVLLLIEDKKNRRLYDEVWDLFPLATEETGVPCLVVLDEFHRLEHLSLEDPFQQFGRKIMVQNRTLYIVASSRIAEARDILREKLNLLFGQFELLDMKPLGPGSCLKAIRTVWPACQENPFLEHLLVQLTRGYPGHLDFVLQELLEKKVSCSPEKGREILDILESILLEPQSSIRQHFESRMRSLPLHQSRHVWVEVLKTVAQGFHRIPEITDRLGTNRSVVEQALRILEQRQFILKQGVFYRIPDKLFQLWLVTVHPFLQGATLTDPAYMPARFRDITWNWMSHIREALNQPFEKQCLALIQKWAGELTEVEGWRQLLPEFAHVDTVKGLEEKSLFVGHRSGNSGKDWVFLPWKGPLQEADARKIHQEMARAPYKIKRKVILGPSPVEMNARLILQEAQIKLWDLETLNHLLDLYGLPQIPTSADESSFYAETLPIDSSPVLPPVKEALREIS